MLSWNQLFCAELPDVMCVPPWHIATRGGKELTVIGSIKSGASHPKVEARYVSQILREGLSQERIVFAGCNCLSIA